MLTAEQRALADRLFDQALSLPPDEQRAFVVGCEDSVVRGEVESLLAFAGGPLGTAVKAIQHAAGTLSAPDFIGQRVGPYRLTRRIGQGGMGAVYQAVRDDGQFEQTVAIKMLRFTDGDPATLQRFRHERQILASLEHPQIARLLDGGAWLAPGSLERQPYIVMEYIEGVPLNTFCAEKKLTIRQRLLLFRQICDALSYAHGRLVVHRDIKPGNILVTLDGSPKLLDFGVAKLLDPDIGRGSPTLTANTPLAMTPDYASPEQVLGAPVSTVTDVYALGAVLYELLTGRRPHQLSTYEPLEIAREICEREVTAPGINRDLDVIVLKAMQKQPARRYQSVEQLSEDIRRFLDGMPILARPDKLMYRSLKFVRRHRLGLAAVCAVFLALAGGATVSTWEAMRANREAATAKAVNEFLQNDLLAQAGAGAQSGPNTSPDPELKVRTALDRAAARVAGKFDSKPLVEAAIRQTIGDAYKDLGLFREAQPQVERAWDLRRRVLGEENPDTMQSLNDLAEVNWMLGSRREVEPLWTRLFEMQRRVLGKEHPDTLNTMNNLAFVFENQGKSAEAEKLYNEVLSVRRRVLGNEHSDTLISMNNLGMYYLNAGKYALAEPLFTKALEAQRRTLGPEHPYTVSTANNLALLYRKQGKYALAESLFSNLREVLRRVLGEEHHKTLVVTTNLATVYRILGKYEQAEPLYSQLVETERRVLGPEHPYTLLNMNNLGLLHREQGDFAQAEAFHTKVLEVQRRIYGENYPDTLLTTSYVGLLRMSQGSYAQAETLFSEVVDRRRVMGPREINTTEGLALLGEARVFQQKYLEAESPLREALGNYQEMNSDAWGRYNTQSMLGASLTGQKRYAEAEPLLLAGYEGMLRREATMPWANRAALSEAAQRIVRLYQNWGKRQKAAEWRTKIQFTTD